MEVTKKNVVRVFKDRLLAYAIPVHATQYTIGKNFIEKLAIALLDFLENKNQAETVDLSE